LCTITACVIITALLESCCQVVCASNAAHDHVLFVDPPKGSKPGDVVTFGEGCPSDAPASAAQVMVSSVVDSSVTRCFRSVVAVCCRSVVAVNGLLLLFVV
jgi:hypothetical protein